MNRKLQFYGVATIAVLLFAAGAAQARADESQAQTIARLETELKKLQDADKENARRQGILAEEVRKLREQMSVPETPQSTGQHGMGPAASRVYGNKDKGFSIGGYGQAFFTALTGDRAGQANQIDLARVVLYTGYKFNDKLLLNAEIEYEHASTETGGSVNVEFAQVDYLTDPKLNVRAGLMLMPLGFINEVHEPLFYHGNNRPEVEQQIIPATWAEMGAGIFGKLDDDWEYRAYVINSMRASKFSSDNLRDGRQAGGEARAEDFSIAVRSDYQVTPEFSVGGSIFTGDQGQGEALQVDAAGTMRTPKASLKLYEAHAQFRKGGLQLRALGTRADLEDADVLSAAALVANPAAGPIGSRLSGAYVEAAYEIMPHLNPRSNQSLALFARRESYDTLDRVPFGFVDDLSKDIRLTTVGVDYKPDSQFVIKLDYRIFAPEAGVRPDEINLGIGWIF